MSTATAPTRPRTGAWAVRYRHAAIPMAGLWFSPFARWRGTLSRLSSLDVATVVTRAAATRRNLPLDDVDGLVLGWTVPQPEMFYGAPTVARRIGLPTVSGPMVSQACATSVAGLHTAASSVDDGGGAQLVIVTDRVSNGPTLCWPASAAAEGDREENWVRDAFARDPGTEQDMLSTAETVAHDWGFTRADADELALLRFEQYRDATARERPYLVAVDAIDPDGERVTLAADEGVRERTAESLAAARPSLAAGVHTRETQTHPADGTAGAMVTSVAHAREVASSGVVRMLAAGFARVAAGRMPEALVPAARVALDAAGTSLGGLDAIATHNPFAVNDLYFARETGTDLEAMNRLGSSLVFGHPQGPTGLRSIAELVSVLRERGGGTGLFTGCAAGDSGAALVLRVEE